MLLTEPQLWNDKKQNKNPRDSKRTVKVTTTEQWSSADKAVMDPSKSAEYTARDAQLTSEHDGGFSREHWQI